MSLPNVNISPPIGLPAPIKSMTPEEILAAFVGAVTELQAQVAQYDIKDRNRELEMAKANEKVWEDKLKKAQEQYAAYEKAKEEAEDQPWWKRALMGIATFGMSELAPQLEEGFTDLLHAAGVHNGPLLTYLSKALTILAVTAVMVVATAGAGGIAGSLFSDAAADGAEASTEASEAVGDGAEEAANSGAQPAESSSDPATFSGTKFAVFGAAQGIQSTNLLPSIAQDAGGSQGAVIGAMVAQVILCLAMTMYGAGGADGVTGYLGQSLSGLSLNASRALQLARALQGVAMLGAAGYGGYQAKREFDAADALNGYGDTQKDLALLNFMAQQYQQGLNQTNTVLTTVLKQSPNAIAAHLAEGYQAPQYLIQG